MPILLVALALVLAIASVPILFVIRFRAASARRRGRSWLANLNLFILAISIAFLLLSSAILSMWVPDVLKSCVLGLVCGGLLSVFGLAFTEWERTADVMFYKPNRWFALIIPLALMLRIFYWLWRAAHEWSAAGDAKSWLAVSGTAGSIGVGAAVAGYYFAYAIGIWRRLNLDRHSAAR